MARDLSYKDDRLAAYLTEFSDVKYNTEPVSITTTDIVVRDDGEYTLERLDIKQLISLLQQHDRDIRQLKQENASLRGQLESIYKDGIDGYDGKIQAIRDDYPKPS